MAGKTFRRAVRTEPIWFEIPDADDNPVRFDCVDILPGGVVMEFGSAGAQEGTNTIKAVRDLFDSAIIEEQHEKFWAMVNDRKARIGVEMLMDIAEFIAGEFTARPTGGSSSDGPSMTSTGGGSTGGALHAVSTYSRPEPIVASTS